MLDGRGNVTTLGRAGIDHVKVGAEAEEPISSQPKELDCVLRRKWPEVTEARENRPMRGDLRARNGKNNDQTQGDGLAMVDNL